MRGQCLCPAFHIQFSSNHCALKLFAFVHTQGIKNVFTQRPRGRSWTRQACAQALADAAICECCFELLCPSL